ncbi:MAG TPA: prepilin-type N-terminal cleavage/methylation domain-containing protein [Pyrinomonadaceae bacterium]|jgi:prepilin-type N-terminal cleavage/methylation domain-containing protein
MSGQSLSASQRGFSLIELLIVVAIIGIIAAITIPYLAQAKQSANSASAISSLRLIHSSEASYKASNGRYGDRAALSNAKFLSDPGLVAGVKSHYNFDVTAGDPLLGDATLYYKAVASPANEPTRWQHYFIDATGVMRINLGAPATASSNPL